MAWGFRRRCSTPPSRRSPGRLSDYCRGDGRDKTAEINRCFADHLFVEVDEPPAGIGYGFHANGPGGGIVLRSGHEVNGRGAASKFLRVGAWERNCKGLINENQPDGASSIKLNNLYIKGFRNNPDVPNVDSNSDATGIAIRAANADKWCRDISLTGVEVHDWTGAAMRFNSGWGVHLTDVKSMNPARGGVQFRTSRDMSLLRVTSGDSGDDAIAFNTDSHFESRAISGITLDRCESYTRQDPQWGAALKFGGATEALVTNSTFRYAKNALVTIGTFPGFDPRNIRVNNCRMLGGEQHSFEVRANHTAGISGPRQLHAQPEGKLRGRQHHRREAGHLRRDRHGQHALQPRIHAPHHRPGKPEGRPYLRQPPDLRVHHRAQAEAGEPQTRLQGILAGAEAPGLRESQRLQQQKRPA
ncbi:MAG: hypothetical protein M3426_15995 [Actinomycetota bacterium]|nr:hypothetical protein [Actinomycetota bacterium]